MCTHAYTHAHTFIFYLFHFPFCITDYSIVMVKKPVSLEKLQEIVTKRFGASFIYWYNAEVKGRRERGDIYFVFRLTVSSTFYFLFN